MHDSPSGDAIPGACHTAGVCQVSAKTLERRACESAFELYLQREFVRAKDALEQLQDDYPGDLVATLDMESIE